MCQLTASGSHTRARGRQASPAGMRSWRPTPKPEVIMRRQRPSAALVVSIIALIVALGGGALAAIPDPSGDVHFCYSKKTGNVQVINANTDTVDCQKGWKNFNLDASTTILQSPNGDFTVR